LVEAQGGAVQAWSAGKGKGAEFTVLLPALDGQPSVTGSRASLSAQDSLRGRRLLVVDDRLDELSLFRTILEAQGADVQTAGSVREALALLEEHGPPDVLVSDIAMPEQDGYELLRIVRALPPELGGQVPAIAITAHARREDRDRVLAAGFTEYIAKPVDPATLVETVASVAES
jgi:CheY-like chemotaxis protein